MPINTTTNPNVRIDASNAGVFSDAAYSAAGRSTAALGPNWHEDTSLSVATASNQMRAFVNDTTKQVVFAFKGTDNLSNGVSDIVDSGASAYLEIHDALNTSYSSATANYSGYQILTDGHSLGGGMSQSFALEHGLNGYGQNALPIASGTFSGITAFMGQNPTALVST